MFRCLMEAVRAMERSKEEVELRIKARAQGVARMEQGPATTNGLAVPPRLRVPRFRVQGRTIYTSGWKSSKK